MACSVFDDSFRHFLGTHRIQRVSSTEKKGRRHTSYVEVYEVTSNKGGPVLKVSDIEETFFRGSGAGGQHRNKTETCVRLTHKPTGTTVIATEQRSQHQNRTVAQKRLRDRLACDTVEHSAPVDQQWNWCEWRDLVTTPNGKKLNMTQVMKKGI